MHNDSCRADRADGDGEFVELDRFELDSGHGSGELRNQFLQRVRQHDQRLHAVGWHTGR